MAKSKKLVGFISAVPAMIKIYARLDNYSSVYSSVALRHTLRSAGSGLYKILTEVKPVLIVQNAEDG